MCSARLSSALVVVAVALLCCAGAGVRALPLLRGGKRSPKAVVDHTFEDDSAEESSRERSRAAKGKASRRVLPPPPRPVEDAHAAVHAAAERLGLRKEGASSAPSAASNKHALPRFAAPENGGFLTAVSGPKESARSRRDAERRGVMSEEQFWQARMEDMRHLCAWPDAVAVPLRRDDMVVRPQLWGLVADEAAAAEEAKHLAGADRPAAQDAAEEFRVVPDLLPGADDAQPYTSAMRWRGEARHDKWARGMLPFPFHSSSTTQPLEFELKYLAEHLSAATLPRHDTCAIVGSGGALKDAGLGAEIDRHGAVFRFNENLVKGYEADVGRRTTYRLVYPESIHRPPWQSDGDGRPTQLLFMPYKKQDYSYLWRIAKGEEACGSTKGFWKKPPLCKVGNINVTKEVRLFSPTFTVMAEECYSFVKEASRQSSTKRASSGFYGMLFALATTCKRVHLYGFGVTASKYCRYMDTRPGACSKQYHSQHEYQLELAWSHQLAQSGFVRFMT